MTVYWAYVIYMRVLRHLYHHINHNDPTVVPPIKYQTILRPGALSTILKGHIEYFQKWYRIIQTLILCYQHYNYHYIKDLVFGQNSSYHDIKYLVSAMFMISSTCHITFYPKCTWFGNSCGTWAHIQQTWMVRYDLS